MKFRQQARGESTLKIGGSVRRHIYIYVYRKIDIYVYLHISI